VKKAFKNIGSIFLAVMVLFSTFSFTVEKHYCGGELADYSFVGNLDRCEMPATTHKDSEDTSLNKTPCCQDSIETIEGTNSELTIAKELTVDEQQFVAVFVFSYLNLFEGFDENKVPFTAYSPPFVIKDIPVLYESFLI